MACRTGCPTQDHASWGECARQSDLQIDTHALKYSRKAEKDKDRRLDSYADLRKEGLQPRSTTWADVRDTYETGGTEPTKVVSSGSNLLPTD